MPEATLEWSWRTTPTEQTITLQIGYPFIPTAVMTFKIYPEDYDARDCKTVAATVEALIHGNTKFTVVRSGGTVRIVNFDNQIFKIAEGTEDRGEIPSDRELPLVCGLNVRRGPRAEGHRQKP